MAQARRNAHGIFLDFVAGHAVMSGMMFALNQPLT
jgi:hypothetical protein